MQTFFFYPAIIIFLLSLTTCSGTKESGRTRITEELTTNVEQKGHDITLTFSKGAHYKHPSFVLWTEDLEGNFLETLFASASIATGAVPYGTEKDGAWHSDAKYRVAALPRWAHRALKKIQDSIVMPTPQSPFPDAISGATPVNDFILKTKTSSTYKPFKIFLEINQTCDWNAYWHNNKYPDNKAYKSSCQPAVVYAATALPNTAGTPLTMKAVGHSHYAGKNGKLYTDLSTLTTALEIAETISVTWE